MEQLILHLIGDYWTQSQWMAENKSRRHWPALVHAAVYSLPFLLLTGWAGWAVIFSTHFLIDRYRLIRYLVWVKNTLGCPEFWDALIVDRLAAFFDDFLDQDELERPYYPTWEECSINGYSDKMPVWLATWLSIIADNTAHLAINHLAIKFL